MEKSYVLISGTTRHMSGETRMIVNTELDRMQKKAIVPFFV